MTYIIMKQKHMKKFILFQVGWMVFYMSNPNNMPCIVMQYIKEQIKLAW